MSTFRIRSTLATVGAIGLSSLALMGAVGACDRADKRDEPRTTTVSPEQQPGGATPQPADTTSKAQTDKGVTAMQPNVDATTVERIANARCEHEKSCKNVGGGKEYATHQICVDSFRASIGNELNSYSCPKGIDRDQVAHCLAAIENEACNHPLDTLQRLDKCRSGALCEK